MVNALINKEIVMGWCELKKWINTLNINGLYVKTTAKILLLPCIFVFIFASSDSFAGSLSYTCVISHAYDLNNNDGLEKSSFYDQGKGSQFSVSRVSGEIIGLYLTTVLATSITVINSGSENYSFKAVALFDSVNKPLSNGDETDEYTSKVQVIEVQEFVEGEEKPFIALSMSGVGLITGICK